jgi:hypothetical protein
MRPDKPQRVAADELSAGFSAVARRVKPLTEEQWARPAGHGARTVADVAHHLAGILADAVSGKPRPSEERLEAAHWWGPAETAAQTRRRARTIVTYLRRLPPERWPVRRRNGFTPLEGAERLAFHTWAHGDAIARALRLDVDLRCLELAVSHAAEELEGRHGYEVVELGELVEVRAPRRRRRTVEPAEVVRMLDRERPW